MTADAAERLRTLAKDYSRGDLSFEAYRRERTSILDSLGALPHERTQRRVQWTRLLAFGGFVIAAGAMVIVLSWHRDRTVALEDRRVPGRRHPELAAASDRIQSLVVPLLNDPDWDDARVATVNEALLEEGPRRIAARQQTQWFQRFAAEVRRHLKQHQSSTLDALAVTIGLDPEALDAPLRTPRPGGSTVTAPVPHSTQR